MSDIRERVRQLLGKKDVSEDITRKLAKAISRTLPLMSDDKLKEFCSDRDKLLRDLSIAQRRQIRAEAASRTPETEEYLNLLNHLVETLDAIGHPE